MTVRMRERNGGPQPRVQLVAEFRHQPRLILRKLYIPLRDDNLAVTRFHPKKAHRQSMPDAGRGSQSAGYFRTAAVARLRALAAFFFAVFFVFGSGTTLGTFGQFVARVSWNGPSVMPLVSVTISSTVA